MKYSSTYASSDGQTEVFVIELAVSVVTVLTVV